MDKVIRALIATGAEMHWHYDDVNTRYVVRLFCGQRSKEVIIGQENVTSAMGAAAMERDLAQQIYGLQEGQ